MAPLKTHSVPILANVLLHFNLLTRLKYAMYYFSFPYIQTAPDDCFMSSGASAENGIFYF